ncbi:putative plus-end-directed kinesin ATPase [Helianthus annuus]|nr:putative plus-end-directed kinesin ATPase [Helianthus annuus]
MGGGQMQQRNAASLYDQPADGNAGPASDAGDAVMARWLQSAGLQHLASPVAASNGVDQRLLPNLLMQGYGAQSAEEKQRLFKLMRNLNFGGESGSEPFSPTAKGSGGIGASDGFYSPDFRGDFGAGLLDLHSMDDTELLTENVFSEPFEQSSFIPAIPKAVDDYDVLPSRQQRGQADIDASYGLPTLEKEISSRENNVAKIKVVVRKRPLNKKELARKEDDVVSVCANALTVHEPKLKVDLTAYVEKHEFCFDAVLDQQVTNDEVYRETVQPIIPIIFQRTKATCFAYGQTGSGKTYTMQPLPLRAAEDLVRLLHQPTYRDQKFKLWLSYFEIYGGKLYDLLSDRKKLCMREDGRQQVCIVGLQEFEVLDKYGIYRANEESSRSHAILQLVVKKHNEVKDTRRNSNYDANESKNGKVVGKISFIDLAGSERGADTTDNDRQTRIEGAEINKSLLALKECIRALDNDQIHIPFRGSKLTEVLRDSFVGNSRTVMISCISPNAGSCEHTLNTLRYADRVKSLSKSGNSKKDQVGSSQTVNKESASANMLVSSDVDDTYEQHQEAKSMDASKRAHKDLTMPHQILRNNLLQALQIIPSMTLASIRRKLMPSSVEKEETVQKVSPPRRKSYKEEKLERDINWNKKDNGNEKSEKFGWLKREGNNTDIPTVSSKQQGSSIPNASYTASKQSEPEQLHDENVNEILEEEEALIAAHRKEIEDTMEIVREEMKLLAEVDKPGSLIDNYVTQLSFVLSRKAASLVSLQARLARFQHRLKEQEILSRKIAPR